MSGRRKKSQIIEDVHWQCTYCAFKNSLSRKYCKSCDKRHKMETELHSPKIVCSPKVQAPVPDVWRAATKEDICKKQNDEARKYMEDITEFYTKNGGKFQDASFPPSAKSLYFNAEESGNNNIVQWLRPDRFEYRELCPYEKGNKWTVFRNPRPRDICQGILNYGVVSALAVLAEQPTVIERIMVTKQFNPKGAYQVRLCKDGEWIVVMVDDKLPCDGQQYILYSQMKRKQLWVPLIEKAMAKVYGCYEALDSLELENSLTILTGCPVKKIRLEDESNADEIWTLVCDAHRDGYIISARCGIKKSMKNTITEQQFEKVGLLHRHYYSVLDAKIVADSHRLVSLHNPWDHTYWNGAWGIESEEWKKLTVQKAVVAKAGIFWMPFEEMIRYYESITICKYQPDWYEIRKKVDFFKEDIFGIKVTETSEFVIELFQPAERKNCNKNRPPLDLCIVVVKEGPRSLNQKVVVGEIVSSSDTRKDDFVSTSVTLEPGNYYIAPLSFNWCQSQSEPDIGRNVIHASKRFEMRFPSTSIDILVQIIIKLALDKGKAYKCVPGATLFYMRQGECAFFVGENKSGENMRTHCEVEETPCFVSTRGSFLTLDVIPPRHRMVLMILSKRAEYRQDNNDILIKSVKADLRSSNVLYEWCEMYPINQHVPHISKAIEPLHQKFEIV